MILRVYNSLWHAVEAYLKLFKFRMVQRAFTRIFLGGNFNVFDVLFIADFPDCFLDILSGD